MSVLENFTKKVTETAKAAAKKSGDIVEVTKLSVAINTEEDKIEQEYTNIGKIIFESYNNGAQVSDEISGICSRIKAHEKNIEEIKQKIQDLKKVKICTNCKNEMDIDIAYCPKCGTKQEIPQPAPAAPTEKVCAACNAANDLDSLYCSKCGGKLGE